MTRYVQHTGVDVYDDETDLFYRFESSDDAQAYAAQAQSALGVPQVDDVASSRYAATFYNLAQTGTIVNGSVIQSSIVCIAPADLSRQRLRVGWRAVTSSGMFAVIGNRTEVLSGKGYILGSGDNIPLESSAEVWAGVLPVGTYTPGDPLYLSVITEYNG